MSASLRRRLDRVEEQHDRPIRERLERIMRTHGVRLSPSEVDEIVTRHRSTPARIRQLHATGLTAEQMFEQIMTERGLTPRGEYAPDTTEKLPDLGIVDPGYTACLHGWHVDALPVLPLPPWLLGTVAHRRMVVCRRWSGAR